MKRSKLPEAEYIAFLDGDDLYLPHTLSTMVSFLDSHRDTAMVCGDAFLLKDNKIMGLKSTISRRPRNPDNFRWETVEFYPTPSTVMLRNSCFAKVGFFDENLTVGAEDWLMWVQLSLYFNMCYIDKPFIYYRLHEDNAILNKERIDTSNRYAVNLIVNAPYFNDYPAHFRAKLLFYRFATAWSVEPKRAAIRYFLHALKTDPTQFPYGIRVLYRGLPTSCKGPFLPTIPVALNPFGLYFCRLRRRICRPTMGMSSIISLSHLLSVIRNFFISHHHAVLSHVAVTSLVSLFLITLSIPLANLYSLLKQSLREFFWFIESSPLEYKRSHVVT